MVDISHLNAGMQQACQEAYRWLGAISPVPPAGAAALDKRGKILAVTARTSVTPESAEAALLKFCRKKGLLPQVAALCLTMEPCHIHGSGLSDCEAIVESGIREVAIGTRVRAVQNVPGGVDMMRKAGLHVVENVEREACLRLMHAFAFHARTGRPFITVARLFDEDGAPCPTAGRHSAASDAAQTLLHRFRKKADAILTGGDTILDDEPQFTVRRVSDYPEKVRVLAILDRSGRVPEAYLRAARARRLEPAVYTDLESCLADLERRGIVDILVESGPNFSESLLESKHWTMQLNIFQHEDAREELELAFNAKEKLPFERDGLALKDLLPR